MGQFVFPPLAAVPTVMNIPATARSIDCGLTGAITVLSMAALTGVASISISGPRAVRATKEEGIVRSIRIIRLTARGVGA